MQVKKFEAPTMKEALKVVKREMGPDAIILKTKENRKGFGLMSSSSIEVTVAITENDLRKKNSVEKDLSDVVKEKIYSSSATEQKRIYNSYSQKTRRNNQQTRRIDPSILDMPITDSQNVELKNTDRLQEEIDELRSMIKQISREKATNHLRAASAQAVNEEISEFYKDLVNSGIERVFVREILEPAESNLDKDERKNYSKIQEKVAVELMERLQVIDILDGIGAKEGKAETTFISVVGPTGVGKTTTVAKIASQAASQRELRVGLINLDMYRVAAADQLKTYAKLMNLPFRNVKTVEELNEAIYDFGSLDLVLIDTTGRSQRDSDGLTEISKYLDQVTNNQALLVLSATTRESELRDISNRFRLFRPCALIFSKLDETGVFGSIVNTQFRTKLPLAYFTVGQRVPEDIERATKERLADLIVDL